MKKPTRKAIKWNRIHARDSNRRRLASKRKVLARRKEFCGVSSPKVKLEGSTRIEIKCPQVFSLQSNPGGVIEVLEKIRSHENRQRNERLYINFREIRDLSASAALVLAAELDRFNAMPINRRNRLKAIDVKHWNPRIRRLLADMGFFELLNFTHPIKETMDSSDSSNVRYVKFRTGSKADGEAIFKLVEEDLKPVIGVMPRGQYLYAAVTEAMTNVVHHAYPPSSHRPNWWLAASHDVESQKSQNHDLRPGSWDTRNTSPFFQRTDSKEFSRRPCAHDSRGARLVSYRKPKTLPRSWAATRCARILGASGPFGVLSRNEPER